MVLGEMAAPPQVAVDCTQSAVDGCADVIDALVAENLDPEIENFVGFDMLTPPPVAARSTPPPNRARRTPTTRTPLQRQADREAALAVQDVWLPAV